MIGKWLRESPIASALLLVVRIVVGWKWLTSGWGKVTGQFDATGYLNNAVNNPVLDSKTKEVLYPNYVSFLDNFAIPNSKLFNFIIPWGEVLVGLGLILGTLTVAATFFGLVMNFMFLYAGTVSINPWLVMLSILILLAGNNAGRFGGDYYIMPYLRRMFKLQKEAQS